MNQLIAELESYYYMLPFERHPFWVGVKEGAFSKNQLKSAELQHVYRTRNGRLLREKAVREALVQSQSFFSALFQTYIEECTGNIGPDHLEMAERVAVAFGATRSQIDHVQPTPGNMAALAIYRDISRRGPGFHFIGAGVVELYYSKLSPKIFDAYLSIYNLTAHEAQTYEVHGPMDKQHGERAIAMLEELRKIHTWDEIKEAVRDAFVATSLHYDGMLQAATGKIDYWSGG